LNYSDLVACLLDELRRRVRSGEVTERSLAQASGLSQPHLHHVLKGKRQLSLAKADSILRHLGLDVLDLIPKEQLRESRQRR
jgi:transcriptional regulator with XRE-family HTH domain